MGVAFWVAGPDNNYGRPLSVTVPLLGWAFLLALGASWLALPARASMLPRPRWLLLAVTVAVPVLVGLALSVGHLSYADPFERVGWRCFSLTLATAPGPFAALLYFGRRLDPVHPRFTGAALGAAVAAWGALMVEVWCPLAQTGHVLIGHVAPVVVLSAAGALAGRKLFGLQRA
jgi:hypothetical protein